MSKIFNTVKRMFSRFLLNRRAKQVARDARLMIERAKAISEDDLKRALWNRQYKEMKEAQDVRARAVASMHRDKKS